jgi:hypothetical protein
MIAWLKGMKPFCVRVSVPSISKKISRSMSVGMLVRRTLANYSLRHTLKPNRAGRGVQDHADIFSLATASHDR